MRKGIVFGSLLTIFLLLMIPVLPAMEYQNTKGNNGPIIDKINLVRKQGNQNYVLSSIRIENNEQLASIVEDITNQPEGICSVCQDSSRDPLLCLSDLVEFIWYMFLFVFSFITIIFIPNAIDSFWSAQNALNHAKVIDCLWAKFIPSFPVFSLFYYPVSELEDK